MSLLLLLAESVEVSARWGCLDGAIRREGFHSRPSNRARSQAQSASDKYLAY